MQLEDPEIALLVGLNMVYLVVTGRLLWMALARRMHASAFGLGAWAAGTVTITLGKIYLIEYLYYLNRSHATTTVSGYLSKLFVYEALLFDSLGLTAIESEAVWRITMYSVIVIVAIFAAVPFAGIRMKPAYR